MASTISSSLVHFQSTSLLLIRPAILYKSSSSSKQQQHRISSRGLEIIRAKHNLKLHPSSHHFTSNPLNYKVLLRSCSCLPPSSDDKAITTTRGGDGDGDGEEVQVEVVVVVEGDVIKKKNNNKSDNNNNWVEKLSFTTKKRFHGTITSTLTPTLIAVKEHARANFALVVCIALAVLVISVREYFARRSGYDDHRGSVNDLVKRGQLRSDRRGMSKTLKYDDPFDNPMVKVSKNNSSVEMCGKVYRLAPVTLTEDEQSSHQKRRSRAYQWKRPTMFLKEGDTVPPDVDPDTVRWIPANHPFATTVNELDEELAQSNVNQKHGVPFRIKAEHEALQKKLESLQNEQKLNKLVIDPSNARDFERPFKSSSKPSGREERRTANQEGGVNTPKSDRAPFNTNTPEK